MASGVDAGYRQDTIYGWWVCAIMCLCFTFSYMDRALLPLLVQPLESALGLTDTSIGLLQGAAFAIFYTLFGFPLARFADNGNRRNLIIAGVTVWCVATVCSGLARNAPEIFVARICVAIGEAVLQPAAVSILADYFSPRRRTAAMSVYSMGVYFGGGLALVLGGVLIQTVGSSGLSLGSLGTWDPWRVVFLVLGSSGILLVPLLLTVREPPRLSDNGERSHRSNSIVEVFEEFSRKRLALLATIVGFGTTAMAATTMQSWAPTLFVRVHGWNLSHIGVDLGALALILSPTGAITGAVLAGQLQRHGRADSKLLVGVVSAGGCALAASIVTMSSDTGALGAMAVMLFLVGFNFGLVPAALTELLPNRMRAVATACFIATSNLLTAASGPFLVGALDDHVFHDQMMVGVSLRFVAPTAFVAAMVILVFGLKPFRKAVAEHRDESIIPDLTSVRTDEVY